MKDFYKILEVDENSTDQDIKKAYREKAKITHPDKNGNIEEFCLVKTAYETLSDKEKRERYDKGEPELKPISISEEAIELLCFIFSSVIEDIDESFLYINFIKNIESLLDKEIKDCKTNIKKYKKQIILLLKIKRNLKYIGATKDFLLDKLQNEILNNKKSIVSEYKNIRIRIIAKSFIKEYSFNKYEKPIEERKYTSFFDLLNKTGEINIRLG